LWLVLLAVAQRQVPNLAPIIGQFVSKAFRPSLRLVGLDRGGENVELLLFGRARMAVCKLGGTFAAERATIGRLLAERFDLRPESVRSLVEQAEQKVQSSAQYFPFTHEICKRLSPEQRIEIIEMLMEGRLFRWRP
jgi:hypothetical protein